MERYEKYIIGTAIVLLSAAYLWFGFGTPPIFNSPDETAYNFFITRYVENGDFFVFDDLNHYLNNSFHPRSISFNGATLVPQGFPGLPLIYGFLGRITFFGIIKYLTPAFALLAALAFFGIVKDIFGKKTGLFSFVLILLLPPFWYYSSRYLYPNVPFVSFLLIAIWSAMQGAFKSGKRKSLLVLFSLAFGLALAARPIESVWVAVCAITAIFIFRKKILFSKVLYSILMMMFLSLPFLSNNYLLYGNVLGSGYTLNNSLSGAENAYSFSAVREIFIYGFSLKTAAKNAINIIFRYLWWYSLPALAGFAAWCFRKKEQKEKIYVLVCLLADAWLLLFYGSGDFTDNPAGRLTLGDSHFRYWLPIFISGLPFVYIFLEFVLRRYKYLIAPALILIAGLSFHNVYFSVDDGLFYVKKNLFKNYEIKKEVEKIVNGGDIIITGRQDKIFFPERRVLYAENIKDARLLESIRRLAAKEFYYYSIGLSYDDLLKANNFLNFYGFRLERVKIFGKEVLYRLQRLNINYA